jgi:hypothetical protein
MLSRPLSLPLAQGFCWPTNLADVSIWRKKERIDNPQILPKNSHFLKAMKQDCG